MSADVALVKLAPSHRAPLEDILRDTPEFTAEEVAVALELIDATLAGSLDYKVTVALREGRVSGYICYGPTPMTEATFDLYWIVVARSEKGRGVGRRLVSAMEAELRAIGAHLIRVETEGSSAYDATRAFYDRLGYAVLATIRDFYRRGNALVIFGRYLSGDAL